MKRFRNLLLLQAVPLLCLAGAVQAAPPAAPDAPFAAADRNGDGRIDEEEYARLVVRMFAAHDRNGDGELSREELLGPDPGLFRSADANRDGKLTFQEIMKCKLKDFRRADRNGDGQISADEASAFTPVSK